MYLYIYIYIFISLTDHRLQMLHLLEFYFLMRLIWSNFICTFRRLRRCVLDWMFLPLELINILRTKHLELKTLTMPQITTYTVPWTNIKIEYTDRPANLSQGGHNKTYNHTCRKYLWETSLETTERCKDKRLVPMVKKEWAIPAKGNMYDTMWERNGEQEKRAQGHWKSLNDDIWIQRSIWIYIRKKNDKISGTFNQCGMSVSDIVCMCMYVGRFLYFCVETPCHKFSRLNGPVSSSYFHLHSSGTSTHSNRHTYLERMPVGPF